MVGRHLGDIVLKNSHGIHPEPVVHKNMVQGKKRITSRKRWETPGRSDHRADGAQLLREQPTPGRPGKTIQVAHQDYGLIGGNAAKPFWAGQKLRLHPTLAPAEAKMGVNELDGSAGSFNFRPDRTSSFRTKCRRYRGQLFRLL
jgi:hypothetical protein